MSVDATSESSMAAIERFVVDNDDLLELEELIYLNAGTPVAGIVGEIVKVIEGDPYWKLVGTRPNGVDFLPTEWAEKFPKLGKKKDLESCWVVLKFRLGERRCTSGASVWPTIDGEIRKKVIERLTRQPNEFGFKLFFKRILGDNFTQIGGKQPVAEWGDDEPDSQKVLEAVKERLKELKGQLSNVAIALQPIFDGDSATKQVSQ